MCCRNVAVFHLGDDLDDLIRIGHLAVSQQNDMTNVVLHFLLNLDDVQERIDYLSPSEICIKVLYFVYCLFEILVSVGDAGLEHSFEVGAETDDIEDGGFGEGLQEKNE